MKQKHHVIMTTKFVYSSSATGWTNEEISFNFWEQTRDSALLQSAVTRLGPIQPTTQWSPAAKWTDCETEHSPLSRAEVKSSWSNTSTPINAFMAQCLMKQRDFICTLQTLMEYLKLSDVNPSQQSSQQIYSSVKASALVWSMTTFQSFLHLTSTFIFPLHYSVNFLIPKNPHTYLNAHAQKSFYFLPIVQLVNKSN